MTAQRDSTRTTERDPSSRASPSFLVPRALLSRCYATPARKASSRKDLQGRRSATEPLYPLPHTYEVASSQSP
jgi:hypothetical protein